MALLWLVGRTACILSHAFVAPSNPTMARVAMVRLALGAKEFRNFGNHETQWRTESGIR